MMETWVRSNRVYQGKVLSLLVGDVRLDDGNVVPREVVEHSGGVAIVPVLDDSVVLIRQFRIAAGREILELPAGRLEGNESPEYCARRELEEEIGYQAGRMVLAASYYSSVGFTNERMFIFLAFQLRKTEQRLEFDERIRKLEIPISEIKGKLSAKEFEDSKTIIGLRELLAYLDERPGIVQEVDV
jgi:8-oxo-dGTP pyrophosphatase MutT (NUDIX family)